MMRRHCILVLMCIMLVGCPSKPTPDEPSQSEFSVMSLDPIRVVFLTRDGCANTPALLANLKSVADAMDTLEYEVINQSTLPLTDVRIGYATPTILYDNRDLFGLPKPVSPFPAPS